MRVGVGLFVCVVVCVSASHQVVMAKQIFKLRGADIRNNNAWGYWCICSLTHMMRYIDEDLPNRLFRWTHAHVSWCLTLFWTTCTSLQSKQIKQTGLVVIDIRYACSGMLHICCVQYFVRVSNVIVFNVFIFTLNRVRLLINTLGCGLHVTSRMDEWKTSDFEMLDST